MCDRAINWWCRVVSLLACQELVHLSIQRNCSIIYIYEARIISAVEYWGSDCVVVKLSLNRTFNRTRPDWHFLLRKFLVFYRWPWRVWRRLVCIVRGWVGSRRFVWSVWPDLPSVLLLIHSLSVLWSIYSTFCPVTFVGILFVTLNSTSKIYLTSVWPWFRKQLSDHCYVTTGPSFPFKLCICTVLTALNYDLTFDWFLSLNLQVHVRTCAYEFSQSIDCKHDCAYI